MGCKTITEKHHWTSRKIFMNKSLRHLLITTCGIVALLLSGCDNAEKITVDAGKFVEFKNAKTQLAALPAYAAMSDPDLIEFFAYGCSHCQNFAPMLTQWEQANPKVTVVYVPVVWNETAKLHAKLFYFIQDKPNVAAIHQGLYDLVATFSRTDSIDDQKVKFLVFMQEQGFQPLDVIRAIDSDDYAAQLQFSADMTQAFDITGTPNVVVSSQYKINNSALQKLEDILSTSEQLLGL
jgi:thiol:disulfide interchange protein DsbA